jgi:hypothetical protein
MVFRSGRYAVSVLVCVVLAGCQPAGIPLPAPTPSLRCTAEAGGAEYACTPYEYDDMVAKDKLYAEAEAVYRKFLAEDERIFRKGGITEPTEVLLETTTGAFLENSMTLYRSFVEEERKSVGGEILLESLTRLPGQSKGGSVVAIRACVDASTTTVYRHGKRAGKGGVGTDALYFGRVDGVLKIQGADGKAVESC